MTEIHQVNAVPSFFPTAQEWSVGMNWLRKHPVVATASAAASTAASVLSYLRNSDSDDEQDDENMPHSVSWSDERGGSLTQVCCSEEQTNAVRKPAMKIKRTRSSLEVCYLLTLSIGFIFLHHIACQSATNDSSDR